MPDGAGEAEAWNLRLVAYHDLDRRPSIKMGLQVVDDRWYLYLGPLWDSGITILDVTDPANPELVNWIQAPENTWHFQVQVADGKMITEDGKVTRDRDEAATVILPPTFGAAPVIYGTIVSSMIGTSLATKVLEAMSDQQFRRWANGIITVIAAYYLVHGSVLIVLAQASAH